MIYAIAPDVKVAEVTVIKFGKSKNPKERLSSLQAGNAVKLMIYAEADWPDEYEGLIHRKFAAKRRLGEWFDIDDDIHDFMNLMVRYPDLARGMLDSPRTDR